MTKDAEEFRWTPKLTNSFFHLRLQHEWLFKKKKQAWKDLHKTLLKNGFSPSATVDHIRKKWSYTIDEYQKAVAQNNTNWIYYDLFHSYLGTSNSMEAFPHWSNEWITKLIEARIKNEHLFSQSPELESDGWSAVECDLREMNLPIECSVNNIDKIWFSLTKTFRSKQRFYVNSKSPNIWPFYETMKKYYKTNNPNILHNVRLRSVNKKKEVVGAAQDSDDECLKDVKNNLMNLEKKESNLNVLQYHSNTSQPDLDDFRWSPQWTESFLHIRLQNEWRFKQKKQSWKELHSIMMENGFPESMTVDHIRRKWNSTNEEYKKAVTLNNTKWIYYNIMHSYLGKADSLDSFENWTNEWIKKMIKLKHKLHNPLQEEKCWLSVETELRREGIPFHCSLRKINLIWSSLVKAFKINHKYISQNKSGILWPYYIEMKEFFEKYEPQVLTEITLAKKMKQAENDDDINCDNIISTDINNDEETLFINAVKKEEVIVINYCRACLGHSEVMTPLIEFDGDINLHEKMMQCTAVQISDKDCFPQYLCQTCMELLDVAYKFKKKCEKTENILKTSWYQKIDFTNIKNEETYGEPSTEKINSCEENDIPMGTDNESIDCLTDNEYKDDIKAEILDSVSSRLHKSLKRVIKRTKHKKDTVKADRKFKKTRKSKNIVMVPTVTESGETVFKRRYIYWKVCDICGKSTQRMKEHMKGHSEVKSHKCTKCPKTFTYSASLQTHLRTHDSTPLKICQVCGKEFFRNLTYKRHLVYHANERKFSCETCGKTFNTSDILRIHIRSHTGERPYSCKICEKTFYSRGCVARHQKVHRKQML